MSESMVVTVFGLGEAGSLFAADQASAGADLQGYDPGDVPAPPGVARRTASRQGNWPPVRFSRRRPMLAESPPTRGAVGAASAGR